MRSNRVLLATSLVAVLLTISGPAAWALASGSTSPATVPTQEAAEEGDAQGVIASSGDLIVTEDTTLTENHRGRIFIAAHNVTLDCAGHKVSGPGLSGIHVEGPDGVTVRNCHVTQFNHGILLIDSDGSQLTGNSTFANLEDGIRLNFSNGNEVTGNAAWSNVRHGVAIVGNLNIVEGNRAVQNGEVGFAQGEGFGSNTYVDNTSTENGRHGFEILAPGGNSFTGNRANNNRSVGFFFGDSHDNQIASNAAGGNADTGFYLRESNDNTMTQNTADSNGLFGSVIALGTGNSLVGNTFRDNAVLGVWAASSNENRFEENVVSGSGGHGWYLADSNDNVLVANVGRLSGAAGFAVEANSSNNAFDSNTATDNAGDGFLVDETSERSILTSNVALRNSTGFVLLGDGARLDRNTANRNAAGGFYVEFASHNMLTRNVALQNGSAGFSTGPNASENTFAFNSACNNGLADGSADAVDAGIANVWERNRFCTTEGI